MPNIKTASIHISLALVAALGFQNALAETVDDPAYAVEVSAAILAACPKTEAEARDHGKIIECIDQTRNSAYKLAADLSTHIKENKGFSLSTSMAQGDLLRYCERPVQANVKKGERGKFTGLQDRFKQTMEVAKGCLESVRRASNEVELNQVFQTTAWNTVANHVNCMTGQPSCVRPRQKGKVELVPAPGI